MGVGRRMSDKVCFLGNKRGLEPRKETHSNIKYLCQMPLPQCLGG